MTNHLTALRNPFQLTPSQFSFDTSCSFRHFQVFTSSPGSLEKYVCKVCYSISYRLSLMNKTLVLTLYSVVLVTEFTMCRLPGLFFNKYGKVPTFCFILKAKIFHLLRHRNKTSGFYTVNPFLALPLSTIPCFLEHLNRQNYILGAVC